MMRLLSLWFLVTLPGCVNLPNKYTTTNVSGDQVAGDKIINYGSIQTYVDVNGRHYVEGTHNIDGRTYTDGRTYIDGRHTIDGRTFVDGRMLNEAGAPLAAPVPVSQ